MKYPIKEAFYRQKSSAKGRGIGFEFTYSEWASWWERQLGPDWFSKRGKTHGKYVMARWYDDGPYAAYNVKCITAVQNTFESNVKMRAKKGIVPCPHCKGTGRL